MHSEIRATQDELHDAHGTARVMIRLPGGCIALHPPLYVRLRRDHRCAATAGDYVHAAIAVTVFLSIVLVSPPVSLCLFPGSQPGTSSIRSVWSTFVPLVVTLAGGVAIALLDTPLRAPLGFGCCAVRHTRSDIDSRGGATEDAAEGPAQGPAAAGGVVVGSKEEALEVPQAAAQTEARVELPLESSTGTVESSPHTPVSVVAVEVPEEGWARRMRATEPLPVAVQPDPLRTLSMPVFVQRV